MTVDDITLRARYLHTPRHAKDSGSGTLADIRDALSVALAASLFAAGLFTLASAAKASPSYAASLPIACPTVVGHAGNSMVAPANTVAGISSAAAQGVTAVEVDVRFSKSTSTTNGNFAVLSHNDDLATLTTGAGSVADTWLEDLQKLSAADYAPWSTNATYGGFNADLSPKTRIPYAYEWISAARAGNLALYLDMKVTPTKAQADKLMAYFNRPEFVSWFTPDRLIYMANSEASLKAMRSWYPDRFTFALIETPTDAAKTRYMPTLTAIEAQGYGVPNYRLEAGTVAYWESYGLRSITWTTNAGSNDLTAERARVAEAGVDVLITDYPAQAQAELCGLPLPSGAKRSK